MTLAPATAIVTAGGTTSVAVAVARGGGLSGNIFLHAEGLPDGVTVSFAPHPLSSVVSGSTMSIVTAPSAAPGRYALMVHASSGAYEATAQLPLEIRVTQ